MRYSQLIAPRTSEVVEAPAPEPGIGQVLVDVTLCGVCASELHPWLEGRPGYPHRFGHEPVGVVAAVGPSGGNGRFKEGDRVTGLFKQAYADLALADAGELLPIPTGVSDEAALGEPLACLVNAHRRTPVELADRVAVVGLGFMGLGMLQLIKLRGPSQLVAIDVREDARRLALSLGATAAYHPDDVPAEFRLTEFGEWQSGRGFDVVVEATGAEAALTLATELVTAHGLLSIVGYHQGGPRAVDVGMWNWKALHVANGHVRRRADLMASMRIALDLAAAGLIDAGALVSHRFGLADVDAAYDALWRKPPGFVKAVVRP